MPKRNSDVCETCGGPISVGDWPMCNGDASKHVPSRPSSHEFEAIVIYRDKNGNIRVPGSGKWKPPKGWQREEIRTRKEADAVTREMGTKDRAKWEELRRREAHFFENSFASNRAEIQKLREGVTDPRIREFMDVAMRKSDERDRQAKTYEPGVFWGVLE